MIKLEDFDWDTQMNLVRGCEGFFVTYKSPMWQKSILQSLTNTFGKKYKNEIKVILTASSKAKRYNLTGCKITLNNNNYKIINSKLSSNVNLKRLRELITLMETEGYLTLMLGYYKNKKFKMGSYLRFHNKLLDGLSKESCDRWGMSRDTDSSLIEIIDTLRTTEKKNVYHSLKKFSGVDKLLGEMKLINKVVESSEICFDGRVCYVRYKKVFHDNLQNSGRIYAIGTFQIENSDLRHTITIDGSPTVEVDVCHIHPSIFASTLNLKLPESYDPYDIGYLLDDHVPRKILRPFMKISFMTLLYAKNRGTALFSIKEMLDENKGVLPDWLCNKTILEALEEHNNMLSACFYKKDQWKFAQFIDASISTKIMLHFANKGVVCLPYHDSWRVQTKYKDELIEVLKRSWIEVMGNEDNFYYKID